ncbi:MAG TPA: c-type cytochrome [Anaerolineae bacterium]|nr:c-type cytochrome [Anaerolineae bacterium]
MGKQLRQILKWLGILMGAVAVLVIGLVVYVQLAWDNPSTREVPQMTASRNAETVARGKYLYNNTLICWSCHGSQGSKSPEEPQAGGLEFDLTDIGPGFGFIYASNITPDFETGIGAWSDGELVRAIREGLDHEGRIIFPIMEAEWYRGLSDEDALALVAYLRSLPAVNSEVATNRYYFPAKALIALGMVKPQLGITAAVVAPPRSVTAEYGEYLASHASGCAACHTPRSPNTGKFDLTRPFAGGDFAFAEEGFSPTGSNLTPDAATGIGEWTEEQYMTAMRTGLTPDGTVMLPFMPWPWYARWSEDDLRAVWLYLRALEPIDHEVAASTLTGTAATGAGVARGEALFDIHCTVCHGDKGAGGPLTSVALKDAAPVMDDTALAKLIGEGFPGTSMPGYGKTLTSEQIADLVAFIRAWEQ